MKTLSAKTAVIIFASLILAAAVAAQDFKVDRFQVGSSALINEIKGLKTANPKMSAPDLAKAADAVLAKTGLPFAFYFDTETCATLKKARDAQKDPNEPLRLGARLKSVAADSAPLALPSPRFGSPECGGCGVELPLLQITNVDFVTILGGRNVGFELPSNFLSNEVMLVDAKDEKVVKRKWRIPFRAVPMGISIDEKVLYMGFAEPELADLSLLVFSEGVFQIGTRTDAEDGGKGKLVPAPADSAWQTIKFDRWNQTYVVKYRPACAR